TVMGLRGDGDRPAAEQLADQLLAGVVDAYVAVERARQREEDAQQVEAIALLTEVGPLAGVVSSQYLRDQVADTLRAGEDVVEEAVHTPMRERVARAVCAMVGGRE